MLHGAPFLMPERKDNMKKTKRIMAAFWLAVYTVLSTDIYRVFAEEKEESTDAAKVVQPIFTVINLFVTAMQAVGAFLFVKGLSELATSLRREDDAGAASAVKGMLAGLILISIRLLLGLCEVPLG